MKQVSRRDFMRKTIAAGLATSSTGAVKRTTYAAIAPNLNRVVYRDLGSTGYKASEIGFGVLHITDTSLLHAAIDSGVNYFDTAHSYMNGKCEETLGRVVQDRRNEIFVTTKIGLSSPEKMVESVDLSLKRLRTDCVDCMLIHGVDSAGMMRDDVMRVFDEMKTAGKARFIGVSTHDHTEVPDLIAKSGFWDMLTIPYNYFSSPETGEKIRRVREAGIAVVGMKNLITIERPRKPYPDIRTEGMQTISNQQALLKWALNNKYIDTVIPGISSFEHLADDVAVMGSKLTTGDRAILRKYGEKAGKVYCRGIAGCTGCSETCPYGVDMGELNRCVNYATGYGNIRLARENYDRLPLSGRVDRCDSCETCKVKCVNGLNPDESIRKARVLFG